MPSGVLIDWEGNLKVFFSLRDIPIELIIGKTAIDAYIASKNKCEELEVPKAPSLARDGITESSVEVEWGCRISGRSSLPYPAGIIQMVELQYCIAHLPEEDNDSDDEHLEESRTSLNWISLRMKHFYQARFYSERLEKQRPGTGLRFRLRYSAGDGSQWSPFSAPSRLFRTLPARPPPPQSLQIVAITSCSAELRWGESCPFSTTSDDIASASPAAAARIHRRVRINGSPLKEFVLIGRSVGGECTVLYSGGLRCSYLATGLYPEFAYSFQLAQCNGVGQSEFGPPVSFLTPMRPKREGGVFLPTEVAAAAACRDAWVELWDPRDERTVYFNTLVALRQEERPPVLRGSTDAEEDEEELEAVGTKEREHLLRQRTALEAQRKFRLKRYKILRHLHLQRSRGQVSSSSSSSSASFLSSSTKSRNELLYMTLRRSHLLADGFHCLAKLNPSEVAKRLKVSFEGEKGLDAGGLTKEAFLLLSQQALLFMGPRHRRWVVAVRSETDGLPQTPGESPTPLLPRSTGPQLPGRLRKEGYFFSIGEGGVAKMGKMDPAPAVLSEGCIQELEALPSFSEQAFLKFFGRLLGKALLDRQLVDAPLSPLLLRHMLGGIFPSQPSTAGNTERFAAPTDSPTTLN